MESPEGSNELYSLLKLGRDATEEEIHRAYKALSTTFHPDKLPPQTAQERREQIQQVFLEFKRARKWFWRMTVKPFFINGEKLTNADVQMTSWSIQFVEWPTIIMEKTASRWYGEYNNNEDRVTREEKQL